MNRADGDKMNRADGGQQGVSRRSFLTTTTAVGTGLLVADLRAPPVQGATLLAANHIADLPRVRQKLVAPPFVPEHDQVAKGGPKIVEIRMVIEEKIMVLDDDGAEIWALTFNGSVPGPFVVVHEGDYVELTLVNPDANAMEHNIDFHAATGALGGGELTLVSPGEEAVLRFKAIKPGVFVYHCAPHGVDEDEYKKYESAGEDFADSMEVMATLTPSHIVFNGAVGALTGDNSLKAKVGETVMIVHAQANRDTRPHLIGGHGDNVWSTGSFADDPQTGLETWFIAGGAAGAAIYTFKQPGIYAYVNHNLIEAFLKGAAAHFKVEGDWNNDLMMQVKKPSPIK
jgi:nitrite reductase (NO-forming)